MNILKSEKKKERGKKKVSKEKKSGDPVGQEAY